MIQDLGITIEKLERSSTDYSERLQDTIKAYASEIDRDLHRDDWKSHVEGSLSAGFLSCLLGDKENGLNFFERSVLVHAENMNEYSRPISTILQYIVDSLKELEHTVSNRYAHYEERLSHAKESEEVSKENLRLKIVHIEADMECRTDDLDEAYASGKRQQAELYLQLGEFEKAIDHYNESISHWEGFRLDNFINNSLSIADTYLKLEDLDNSRETFLKLLEKLAPDQLELGDKLPEFLTDNIAKLSPLFYRVELEESLSQIAEYAEARLEVLSEMDLQKNKYCQELKSLMHVLVTYNVAEQRYQEVSGKIDQIVELGKHFDYPPQFSRIKQAEFLLRAGDFQRARELMDGVKIDGKPFEGDSYHIANVYLQLGDVKEALDTIDDHCTSCRKYQGPHGSVFYARRMQLKILRKVMGGDLFCTELKGTQLKIGEM